MAYEDSGNYINQIEVDRYANIEMKGTSLTTISPEVGSNNLKA